MAKSKILINRTTGKEFPTTDPDSVMERFPKTFRYKPDAEVSDEVKALEASTRTVADVEKHVLTLSDTKELESLLKYENDGKKRTGAIDAINARIEEITNQP